MAVSSVHIELDKFFHETRGLNKDNCWEWFESFRNTLLYKGYEENPHPYALALLDETECYSAYCAVCNIEGRVIAELERKKETFDFEKVYKICMEKKGSDYAQLKEKESRYLELHPEANRWRDNNRTPSTKSKAKKATENHDVEQTRNDTESPKPQPVTPDKPSLAYSGRGGNVHLTDDEYAMLLQELGNKRKADKLIDSLDYAISEVTDIKTEAVFKHEAGKLSLPLRRVTDAEAVEAEKAIREFVKGRTEVNYVDTAKARAAANAEAFGNVDRRTPYQKNQDELHQLYVLTSEKLKELK